ncbi:MAG: DMT family transporter, partial [Clostridia bacterium]|nr:DMT family transporter [Clostridia bacterium]
MKPIKIYLLMTVTTVFWAGAFVAAKIGITEMTPVQLTFYRFFFASLVIVFIMMRKEERKDWLIKKEDMLFVFLLS